MDLAQQNADKLDTVIEKAGELVDKQTEGKFAAQINTVEEAAKKALRSE
ncbi:antitoxin [Nocardia panacis]|uniref:Antitoxin n=2 Tax=Nocardia panacis TaxID=2340916 RepID=A0A3A4KRZ5_9NOCA|nr:antitoxin [Nocardia panacis]